MFGHQDDQQMLNDQAAAVQTPAEDIPSSDPAPYSAGASDLPVPASNPVMTHDDSTIPTPPSDDQSTVTSTSSDSSTDDLLDLKQQALSQLSPIVDHLEQSPEERFNTTMMMIQASDNQALLKKAYEAAQEITDEKHKAQALLDIVNEINYFTHPHQD